MTDEKIIGVVAGAGPVGGLDLLNKIGEQTLAAKDQDHLTIASLSQPSQIPDRTDYLLTRKGVNPAHAVIDQLRRLEKMGAGVAGIACNTAHAPRIFNVILDKLRALNSQIKVIHMIEEVVKHLHEHHSQIERIGILSSTGTYKSRIYPKILESAGFSVFLPSPTIQEQMVHRAVYDFEYGIKACGYVTEAARERLLEGVRYFQQVGVSGIILACTEISLAIREKKIDEIVIVDPTLILARALIREANPNKLKPIT